MYQELNFNYGIHRLKVKNNNIMELLESHDGHYDENLVLTRLSSYSIQVPLDGFKALQGISGNQKFQIHKAYGSPDHLPSAHTWYTLVQVT